MIGKGHQTTIWEHGHIQSVLDECGSSQCLTLHLISTMETQMDSVMIVCLLVFIFFVSVAIAARVNDP